MQIDVRHASHPEAVRDFDTETLRRHFLVETVFASGEWPHDAGSPDPTPPAELIFIHYAFDERLAEQHGRHRHHAHHDGDGDRGQSGAHRVDGRRRVSDDGRGQHHAALGARRRRQR